MTSSTDTNGSGEQRPPAATDYERMDELDLRRLAKTEPLAELELEARQTLRQRRQAQTPTL